MRLSEIIEAMKETLGNKMDEEIEVNEPKPEPDEVQKPEASETVEHQIEKLMKEIQMLKEENSKLASTKTIVDREDDGSGIEKAIMKLCRPEGVKEGE